MVPKGFGNRTLALYTNHTIQKQHSLLHGTIPDTWMIGGIALIIVLLVLLIVVFRCAVHYIPRLFGYETASRLEGPGHSLGMYSLDIQTQGKHQGYANVGYIHRESVTTA
ncbi:hypothetical protein ANCCAN_05541 [Ancylostoma caninum]|uniref:Uncharacterized protein n=1 Tax=Ancylostoma caninum TaxID=29170 RepID=A0A368GVJ5_ANCCA|nr:hypothetical protein ANCCAN_05541 [Ancylostoma caninum]